MSIEPYLTPSADHVPSGEKPPRNWLALILAMALVLIVCAVLFFTVGRTKSPVAVVLETDPPDAYAANLAITNVAMSEAGNLAGGKVTYLDGHIANQGNRTITGITVQVLFRNFAHEVVQNESQPLKLIRMRDPYIDVGPLSATPLQPGQEKDFRLIFDTVSRDWDGAYPQLRLVHIDAK